MDAINFLKSKVIVGAAVAAIVLILSTIGLIPRISEGDVEAITQAIVQLAGAIGAATAIGARVKQKTAPPISFTGGAGPLAIVLLCLASAPVLTSCATMSANLDRAERATAVGDVLVNAAEEAGLIDASTAERVRGYIANARTAIVLARIALEEGNRERAAELALEAQAAVREAEAALRYAAPAERQPTALNDHVAELKGEADGLAVRAAAIIR